MAVRRILEHQLQILRAWPQSLRPRMNVTPPKSRQTAMQIACGNAAGGPYASVKEHGSSTDRRDPWAASLPGTAQNAQRNIGASKPSGGVMSAIGDIGHSWIRSFMVACCTLLMPVALVTGRAEGASDGNVVAEWNAIAQNYIVTIGAQPIQRSQLWMTLVHVAIYDAVQSIDGRHEPFKVTPARLRPASREAAAVAAGQGALGTLPSGQLAR